MSETRKYFGCRIMQRHDNNTIAFFTFYARVKDIRLWCGIKRAHEFPEGTQRVLRPSRSRAVTRFLERGTNNTIPNNMLVAFEPGMTTFTSNKDSISVCVPDTDIDNDCDEQIDWGTLEFTFEPHREEHLRPALIVDGQHRMDGMSHFEREDLPILIVALIDAPLQEQAFQFIVINGKAVRVSTDNAKSIIANLTNDQERELASRLMGAGISYAGHSAILKDINDLDISPFKRLLNWEYNREGKKQAIENGVDLVEIATIEVCTRFIRDKFDFLNLDEDEDTLVEFFCAIWRAVKEEFSDLWGSNQIFMSKVNITALNEFLVERLKTAWAEDTLDAVDPESIQSKTASYLKPLSKDFWSSEWTVKIQDNANVRNRIKEDLWTMTTNAKQGLPWSRNLKLSSVTD